MSVHFTYKMYFFSVLKSFILSCIPFNVQVKYMYFWALSSAVGHCQHVHVISLPWKDKAGFH